jgi:ATP-binding cassette, subfamily B, bacterial PglK
MSQSVFKSLKTLYRLLEPAQQHQLITLQVLVIIMSFAEVVGVMSIGPFMALVGNLGQLQGDGLLAQAYRWTGLASPTQFVVLAGAASLTALATSAVISMYTLWRLSMYGALVGAQLGNRLYAHYMAQPWLFHASGNSAQLTNKIAQETQRVTLLIINAFMQLNAKLLMACVMAGAILIYNPAVALVGVSLFALAYLGLYKLVRMRLERNGRDVSQYQTLRFMLMAEGFGGIKDALLLGRQRTFTERFTQASNRFAVANASSQIIGQVPRYAVELLAFGSVIALVVYLMMAHRGDVGTILPVLSVYALAGMKLLPAFQQVYASITQIRSTLPALDNIKDDLRNSLVTAGANNVPHGETGAEHLAPTQSIQLQGIRFRYPNAEHHALNQLNITIPANRVVGLVGSSGSGKSTAVDVLLGLIIPQEGALLVDGAPVQAHNLRAWQNSVGFVAQSIFLADSTIRANIAFGLPPEAIDEDKVKRAAEMAHLTELVNALPQGLGTFVGERGVQLSGGQRQRIGIARALYHDADVLVLDEATSALDGITEKLIMDAVHDFGGKKTIIMVAHRLATVKPCDWIVMMQDGHVVDEGTYDTLLQRNDIFRRMAAHA